MKKILLLTLFILSLTFISATEIEYFHPNGSTGQDCFDGTCLTMPYDGPVYNSKGNINWGCGPCDHVTAWAGENIKALAQEFDCVEGMKFIPGVELCIEADNGNLWNIKFTDWSSAGLNEFGYVRTSADEEESSTNEERSIKDIKSTPNNTETEQNTPNDTTDNKIDQKTPIDDKATPKDDPNSTKIISIITSLTILLFLLAHILTRKLTQKKKKHHKK
jgi:hypothetical protein